MSTPAAEPAKSTSPATNAGLRASDADRAQVADVLSAAYAEGRLTRDEHDERIDQAMAAKTFDELIPVTRDLVYTTTPKPPSATQPQAGSQVDTGNATEEPERMIAVFSGVNRAGRWRMRRQTQAYALFGGINLDLRDAVFEAPVVEISGFWCFGGMEIKVPPGVEVRDQTVGVFGGSDISNLAPTEPGAPVLVIKGLCLFGGVAVKTPRPRRQDRDQRSGGYGWSRGDSRADRMQERLERHGRRIEDRMRRRD